MNGPTNRQQDLCAYFGIFGVLITLTCIVQVLVIANAHWIPLVLLVMYLFVLTSFILLALQKAAAPLLLIISSFLSLLAEAALILTALFSAIVIIQFIYSFVITIVIYMDEIPKRLKEKAVLLKMERESWAGKI
jgi:hypothetical protein